MASILSVSLALWLIVQNVVHNPTFMQYAHLKTIQASTSLLLWADVEFLLEMTWVYYEVTVDENSSKMKGDQEQHLLLFGLNE